MGTIYTYSSGGAGDVYIALLKILPLTKKDQIVWRHNTGTPYHNASIAQIMKLLPSLKDYKVTNYKKEAEKQEKLFFEQCPNAIRITSQTKDIEEPCPNFYFFEQDRVFESPYAVIQPVAGRPNDNTKRGFSKKAIEQLCRHYNSRNMGVVLLGENFHFDGDENKYIYNMTGLIEIFFLLTIIHFSEEVIAPHGLIAYISQSMKKHTHVIFDLPILDHYMANKEWKKCANVITIPPQPGRPTVVEDANWLINNHLEIL